MLPVVAAIAGATLLNNVIGHNQAIDQNTKAANLSREQMEFQERMSNTAHQREVKDLQAAGLNPTLSAGGNGASTPAGSAAPVVAPQIEMPDIFGAIMGMTQLEQAQQRLEIDKGLAASTMAKNLTDQQLTKAETILKQKGMVGAELEGMAAGGMKKLIEKIIKPPARKNMSFDDFLKQEKLQRVP